MKILKKFLLVLFFILLFFNINSVQAAETSDFDINALVDNFNNNSYVAELSSIGISLKASISEDSIIIFCNAKPLTYTYDKETGMLYTEYPHLEDKNFDIANSIFIDTISVMQGNTQGDVLPFVSGDFFCYAIAEDTGVDKLYKMSEKDSTLYTCMQIYPSIKLEPQTFKTSIDVSDFKGEYETIYTKEDTTVTRNNSICFKTYKDDNTVEIYIGEPYKITEASYESVLNILSIIFGTGTSCNEAVKQYFSQNYSDFSVGDFEFDGISIQADVASIPVKNAKTILVSPYMKYAKITVDTDKVNEQIKDIKVSPTDNKDENANVQKPKPSSSSRIIPLVVSCIIILVVFMIILSGVLIPKD